MLHPLPMFKDTGRFGSTGLFPQNRMRSRETTQIGRKKVVIHLVCMDPTNIDDIFILRKNVFKLFFDITQDLSENQKFYMLQIRSGLHKLKDIFLYIELSPRYDQKVLLVNMIF